MKLKATVILGYTRTGKVDPELSWDVSPDTFTNVDRIQVVPTIKESDMAGYGKKKAAGKKKSKYK